MFPQQPPRRRISALAFAALSSSLVLVACQGTGRGHGGAEDPDRTYLIERVDDTNIAQLYADGFDRLSLDDKLLCYHLGRAAIAGRDIFLDQRFAYNLELRDVLEELYVHKEALAPEVAAEVERFTKLFWVHNGIHHNLTTRKIPFRLNERQFLAAAESARAAAAGSGHLPDEARLRELFDVIVNPDTFQSVTNKSGDDPVRDSANNLYVGVTTADLEGFTERNPLNSRLVKQASGELVEEIYRAGDPSLDIKPGRYARQITEVITHLRDAIQHAPEPTKKWLRALIRYYKSGSVDDWRAFNIAWVQDTDSVVDALNGFIEVYVDARGQKGAWESVVSFLNVEKTEAIERLAKEAQWFEDRMPWADEFKKADVKGITARAISVIIETGDSGPITPIGINLPNEADIRENYGSKSVNLSNVVEAYGRLSSGGSAGEFCFDDAELERAGKYADIDDVHTNLHEVVGHASGKIRPEIKNPAQILGTYYSTLEEGRADLIGLYWMPDPKLQELGMVPNQEAALAQYEAYARNALVQLRRVPLGGRVEEDHMRNRQMIVLWLIDNTDAIRVENRDGKVYYRVSSVEAFRRGCGELLAEVMRIKATGDFKAGKKLVDTYGTKIDPELHAAVLDRIKALNLASVTGFVQPELRLKRNEAGEVVDVVVQYPLDLAEQMLGWSGRSTGSE